MGVDPDFSSGFTGSSPVVGSTPTSHRAVTGFESVAGSTLYARAMQLFITLAVWVIPTLIAAVVFYWVIRLAVRHAIKDARDDERREEAASRPATYLDADGL